MNLGKMTPLLDLVMLCIAKDFYLYISVDCSQFSEAWLSSSGNPRLKRKDSILTRRDVLGGESAIVNPGDMSVLAHEII